MASTSTNKQPLLVDHILHKVVDLSQSFVSDNSVTGTNSAALLVDSTTMDGAIIEDIYAISRKASQFSINLYLSSANDYLRPQEGVFIGTFDTATTVNEVTHWETMPRILAPVPHTGDVSQFQALYIPKGRALWAAFEGASLDLEAPIIGAQGGWY
jgi:hypothetical protein